MWQESGDGDGWVSHMANGVQDMRVSAVDWGLDMGQWEFRSREKSGFLPRKMPMIIC